MSQTIDLLIKNGSCFIEGKLEKVDLAVSNSKIQEIGWIKKLEGKNEIDAKFDTSPTFNKIKDDPPRKRGI